MALEPIDVSRHARARGAEWPSCAFANRLFRSRVPERIESFGTTPSPTLASERT